MNRISLVRKLALCAAIGLAPAAWPKGPSTAPSSASTRTYNVRDLLEAQHPDAGYFISPSDLRTTRNEELFPKRGKADVVPRQERIDALVKAIEETIDPNTWRDNGGQVGAIKCLDGALIVTQTEANHAALLDVLDSLRVEGHRVVTVRAHWVALEKDQIDAVTSPLKQPSGEATSTLVADLAAIAKLVAPANHFRAQTTALDGQTVRISSGPVRNVPTDATPVVGNNVVGYASTANFVQFGLSLELTATFNAGHTSALIDVSSELSACDPDAPKAPTTQSVAEPPQVGMVVQHLHADAVIPLGKAVVVGGMTLDPKTPGGDGRQMYLILEVVGDAK